MTWKAARHVSSRAGSAARSSTHSPPRSTASSLIASDGPSDGEQPSRAMAAATPPVALNPSASAPTTPGPRDTLKVDVAPNGGDDDARSTWGRAFAAELSRLRSEGVSYRESADFLRALVRKASLRFTDVRDDPAKFFAAHRLLAAHAPAHGPGFWIRFTVQFNLFAGTVVALGGAEQLAELEEIQAKGQLGCFCLTERLAGVNSGLVVNTTATWDASSQAFVIHSPNEGAVKNWISQGLTADKAVCIADLRVGEQRLGPHGFLIDMRDESTVRGNKTHPGAPDCTQESPPREKGTSSVSLSYLRDFMLTLTTNLDAPAMAPLCRRESTTPGSSPATWAVRPRGLTWTTRGFASTTFACQSQRSSIAMATL